MFILTYDRIQFGVDFQYIHLFRNTDNYFKILTHGIRLSIKCLLITKYIDKITNHFQASEIQMMSTNKHHFQNDYSF